MASVRYHQISNQTQDITIQRLVKTFPELPTQHQPVMIALRVDFKGTCNRSVTPDLSIHKSISFFFVVPLKPPDKSVYYV